MTVEKGVIKLQAKMQQFTQDLANSFTILNLWETKTLNSSKNSFRYGESNPELPRERR